MRLKGIKLRYVVVIVWVTFTAGLAFWWLMFGLRQSERLLALQSDSAIELARHQRMLVSEGAILILLVLAGGISLVYFMTRERRHYEKVRQFFATYTHDLKTSLASLRLQAETLQEDLAGSAHSKIIQRLVKDTVRLELQLENSLYLANQEARLFLEELSLQKTLNAFRDHWPDVAVDLVRDGLVRADARALESILKNLIQNAIHHGGATRVTLEVEAASEREVVIHVRDNGRGFQGDPQNLGQLFVRHNSRSGSGVGLYLVHQLAKQMGGTVHLKAPDGEGFVAHLRLEGRVK